MAARDPRVRAIEIEANRRAGADGRNSREERMGIRNQLRAEQGLGAERRRRGGLAGTWDRNKQVIKPLVSGALGMVPGIGFGLAAGAGALMGGLDREGKSGVGFDVGQGLKGGVSGAAAGAAGAGLKGMFTGPGFVGGMQGYANQIPGVSKAFTNVPPPAIDSATAGVANANNILASGGRPIANALTNAGKFIAKNPTVVGTAVTAGAQMAGQSGQNRIQRERFSMEKAEFDRQNAERERMRSLLMPYFTMLQQRMTGRSA